MRGREQNLTGAGDTGRQLARVQPVRWRAEGVRTVGTWGLCREHEEVNPGCGCGAALQGLRGRVVAVPSGHPATHCAAALELPSKSAVTVHVAGQGKSRDSSSLAVLSFLDVHFRIFPPLYFLVHTLRPSSFPCCSSSRSSPSFSLMTVLCWCPVSAVGSCAMTSSRDDVIP